MSEALQIMIGTLEGLLVFFLLFPGFFVERLTELFQPYERKDSYQKLTNSAFYTFILYIVYQWLRLLPWPSPPMVPFKLSGEYPYLALDVPALIIVLLLTFLLTLALPLLKRVLFWVAGMLGATNQTGAIDTWVEAFQLETHDGHGPETRVKLKDGTLIRGWARGHSTPPAKPQLLMSAESGKPLEVTWPGQMSPESLQGEAILLGDISNVEWIMFEEIVKPEQKDNQEPTKMRGAFVALMEHLLFFKHGREKGKGTREARR